MLSFRDYLVISCSVPHTVEVERADKRRLNCHLCVWQLLYWKMASELVSLKSLPSGRQAMAIQRSQQEAKQGVIQRVLNAGNSAKPVWKVLGLSIVCDIDPVAIVTENSSGLRISKSASLV